LPLVLRFRPSFHKDLFVIAFPVADALDGFIQIIGFSVRIDVHQLDSKVRVLGIRGDKKCYLDGLTTAFSSAFFGLRIENLEANSTSILIFSRNGIMI
jgi:hypothetical protein